MNNLIKKIRQKLKEKKGFTLLEVLVALALLAIVLPLSFRLFSSGSHLVSKAKMMISDSCDVEYAINSGMAVEGVSNNSEGTGVPESGTIYIYYDNLPHLNDTEIEVVYSSRKKGDVVHYTFEEEED